MIKFVALFALLILTGAGYSQDSKYFDAPFGGGGGFIPGWYFVNVDPLNEQLKGTMPELNSGGIFTTGGGGFIYIGVIKNFRIGGMGFGGSASESNASSDGFNREVIYSISGGGVTIEYTLPFVKKVGISLGSLIGGAGIQIEAFRNNNNFDWNDIWNEVNTPAASTVNIHRTLKNNFWIISPTLNIDIPFYRFLSFRIGAGYQFSLGDKWKIENEIELSGVPAELNGRSFFIQSGIFIGFFSY
ncbi:MAG TPA: hypothetical protein VMT35_16900 [Ignavibacteriaceae bacterium]|nr:hypothetical protein [Ignavibacteriaceae bacterium]